MSFGNHNSIQLNHGLDQIDPTSLAHVDGSIFGIAMNWFEQLIFLFICYMFDLREINKEETIVTELTYFIVRKNP